MIEHQLMSINSINEPETGLQLGTCSVENLEEVVYLAIL